MNNTTNSAQKPLTQSEALILSKIPSDGMTNQREISRQSGLSLGMISILIQNLVHKGYVKLSRLNKKNIRYLLTPKGFSEQYRLTWLYIQDTFSRLDHYKKWVRELLEEKIKDANIQFIIIGDNELSDIVEVVLKSFKGISHAKIAQGLPISSTNTILLDCSHEFSNELDCSKHEHYIHVTDYLSRRLNQRMVNV